MFQFTDNRKNRYNSRISASRLTKDQQTSRFVSRDKLVTSAWETTNLAKAPLEKLDRSSDADNFLAGLEVF